MRMQEAMEIINQPKGFRVAFEVKEPGVLRSDYFPDKCTEELIPIEEEAWDLAKKFAMCTVGKVYNVYVVNNESKPVDAERCEYHNRRIYNRYPT